MKITRIPGSSIRNTIRRPTLALLASMVPALTFAQQPNHVLAPSINEFRIGMPFAAIDPKFKRLLCDSEEPCILQPQAGYMVFGAAVSRIAVFRERGTVKAVFFSIAPNSSTAEELCAKLSKAQLFKGLSGTQRAGVPCIFDSEDGAYSSAVTEGGSGLHITFGRRHA